MRDDRAYPEILAPEAGFQYRIPDVECSVAKIDATAAAVGAIAAESAVRDC